MDGTMEYKPGDKVWVRFDCEWRKGRLVARTADDAWLVRFRYLGRMYLTRPLAWIVPR